MEEAESKDVRRKSKRRSSFVSGRIQQVLPQGEAADLSRQVAEDGTPEDRLAQLLKLGFQYTAAKLQEEFPESDIQQLTVEGNEVVNETVKKLQDANILKRATQNDRYLPNPKNVFLDQLAETFENFIEKLKKEQEQWEVTVKHRTHRAEEAERRACDIKPAELGSPPDDLLPEQLQYLQNRPQWDDIQQSLNTMEENHPYKNQLAHITSSLKMIQRFNGEAESYILEQAELLQKACFDGVERDCKKLIDSITQTGDTCSAMELSEECQMTAS